VVGPATPPSETAAAAAGVLLPLDSSAIIFFFDVKKQHVLCRLNIYLILAQ
jgi:hypothetical protein